MKEYQWSTYVIGKRAQLQTWNLLKPARVSSPRMIKDAKSLSTLFLKKLKPVSYGSRYTDTIAAFLAREHNGYCAFWKHLPFDIVEAAKTHTKWRGGMSSLSRWKAEKVTFLASAGLWEHNAWQQLVLAFSPSALGYMLTSQRLKSKHLSIYTKEWNAHMPQTPAFISQIHTHTHTHTQSSSVCTSANKPVPSGITVQLQAMEAKRDNRSL